jgi:hypothetical protein
MGAAITPTVQRSAGPPASPTIPSPIAAPSAARAASIPATARPVQRVSGAQRQADASESAGMNIDDLADQVLRRIRGELRIERERRGSIADRRG